MREFSTPMMKQFMEIKQQYKDCLLFFRLGDFYELFLEDATLGAKILDITLTQRPSGKDGHIPMAGVPFHAADSYIAKLVKAGHKIAICEQVSEPDQKGIVDREVVRIVTPGTVVDEKTLEKKEHNYTMSLSIGGGNLGIAMTDVSTGDFQVMELPYGDRLEVVLKNELSRFNPAECILSPEVYNDRNILRLLSNHKGLNIYPFTQWDELVEEADWILKRHFKVKTLGSFGLEDNIQAIQAAAALLGYLRYTQKHALNHIRSIHLHKPDDHLIIDHATIVNLEIFSTIREREQTGSLVQILDNTCTAMGGRMFRSWLRKPLVKRHKIKERLDVVEELTSSRIIRDKIRHLMEQMYDIERIVARLSLGMGNAHNLINLKNSLTYILDIKELLNEVNSPLLMKIDENISEGTQAIISLIDSRILDNPSADLKNGHLIKDGIDNDLDSLRHIVTGGKEWMAKLESTERKKTGINSLKIRFNKVFGYYIEISKSNLHLVPEKYIRKQSMVNAERFITPELKEQEEKILSAEEKLNALEYLLFLETVEGVLMHMDILQQISTSIAELDCLANFAWLAEKENYIKPVITETGDINIEEGRHPMVEKVLVDEQFVPNDVLLNAKDHQLLVLTGPNMAGKSVYMRQVSLIVLMAHIGMFVPAKKASISIVDRIFVRSGASDAITSGLSTFMVEMVETAHILHHATSRSLVIMDEIGRGTSTYDGISIAWAVAEHLVTNAEVAAKTLFATHYHELQELEDSYPEKVKNYQMEIEEKDGEPIFLHKIGRGRASHSYAIAVGKLAGLPESVTDKANEILQKLESRDVGNDKQGGLWVEDLKLKGEAYGQD